MITEIYNQINYEIFGNELDVPEFKLHNDSDFYGWFYQDNGIECIFIQEGLTYFEGVATMAHEMIHQWQFVNEYKMNHGVKFMAMARQIEIYYNLKRGTI